MLGSATKQPADILDYDVDFERWLPTGDALSSAVAVADTGLTVVEVEVIPPLVKVWLSGGTLGNTYKVTVTTTTTESRVKEVAFIIRVTDC